MLKTTYQIFDSPAGKTIVFNNLYFINGEFVFNGSEVNNAEISTYPNVHYRHTNFELWSPSIRELPEDNTIPVIETTHFYLKETLNSHPAHVLLDDVFSVFYGLYKCKLDYDPCVCIIEMHERYDKIDFYDWRGAFKCLFGQEAITFHHFKRTSAKVCFKTFVVGNGDLGLHSYDSNYAAPFQDDIWKQFRNALYKKSDINLELGNKIIYVDSNNFPIKDNLKKVLEKNNIEIIHWSDMLQMKDQLNFLKNVKIYIATEGADILNSIFLPDNAMVIDLGRMYAIDDYKALGYCVDWAFPSLSYIDVFYFEDYYTNYHRTQETTPNSDDLMQMIEYLNDDQKKNNILLMRTEIYDNFASKIVNKIHYELKLNNYSPNARLLIENYPDIKKRNEIVEDFKRGSPAYACNDKIRPFRIY
jgi:hypothetical protein